MKLLRTGEHGALPARFALVSIGMCYPVLRIIWPDTGRIALFIPLLLLLVWVIWRAAQPVGLLRTRLALPLLLVAASLSLSSLLGVAESSTILASLFHWGAVGVLLFLAMDVLAAGWSSALFVRAALLTSSMVLLVGLAVLLQWWGEWLLLWRPGDELFPVPYRKPLGAMAPNHAAMMLNVGLPLAVAALWQARTQHWRWLWGLWLLAATVVLFFTSSRGGWLGAVAAVGVVLIPLLLSALRARRWRRLGVALALASGYTALFAVLLFTNLLDLAAQRAAREQLVVPANASSEQVVRNLTTATGRTVFWNYALQFFGERPVLGIGPGGFTTLYARNETHSRAFLPADPHNIYLGVLTESGIVGAASLGLLALVALWLWWHGWREATPLHAAGDTSIWQGRLLPLACAAVGAGMLVHGMVEVYPTALGGIVLLVLAACLPGYRLCASGSRLRMGLLRVYPRHLALVVVALLAWGSSSLGLLVRGQRAAMQATAQAAIQRGDLDQSLALYDELLARWPSYGPAYTGRATTLAWQAFADDAMLPLALAAQDIAAQQHPENQAAPVNRGALLLEMGELAEAEGVLLTFAEADRTRWAAPYLLLARAHEQQGNRATARDYWQMALTREPAMSESAACLASAICPELPLRPSAYTALLEARRLLNQPQLTEADLRRIWQLADAWNSIDVWAVGVLAAQRAHSPHWEARFRAAATGQAEMFTQSPTPQLALVLLRTAMDNGDRQTVNRLARQWLARPPVEVVPQVTLPTTTATERELAQTVVDAAAYLDDPVLLEAAEHSLQRLTVPLP